MSRIIIPGKSAHPNFALPRQQPRGKVEIDWSNHLSQGLKYSVVPSLDFSIGMAPIGNKTSLTIGQEGAGRRVTTAYYWASPEFTTSLPAADWTIAAHIHMSDSFSTGRTIVGFAEASGSTTYDRQINLIDVGFPAFNAYIFTTGARNASGNATVVLGQTYRVVIRCKNNVISCWTNGVSGTPTAVESNGYSGYTSPQFLVGYSSSISDISNILAAHCVYRAWSDAEIVDWSNAPWRIFRPANDNVFFLPSSALATIPVLSAATVLNITATTATPRVTVTF